MRVRARVRVRECSDVAPRYNIGISFLCSFFIIRMTGFVCPIDDSEHNNDDDVGDQSGLENKLWNKVSNTQILDVVSSPVYVLSTKHALSASSGVR